MVLDQSHRSWAVAIFLATGVVSLLYIHQFHPAWLPFLPQPKTAPASIAPGRTPLGLTYGSIALAIFIFAGLLGWRRKRPALRIGRIQSWLRAHIWFSIFTIPLVLLHAGFVTGGPMTTLLMVVYAIVMLSGFFGLALQQFLPGIMAEELPLEAIFEQIPHIRSQLLARALVIREAVVAVPPPILNPPVDVAPVPAPAALGAVVAEAPAKLDISAVASAVAPAAAKAIPPRAPYFSPEATALLDGILIPYLEASSGKRLLLGNASGAATFFHRLRLEIPQELEPQAKELEELCEERRLLDLQTTYQHWLHGWLIVHVPLSVVLLILTVWHAVVAQFFR